jgi:AAA ATPase domain
VHVLAPSQLVSGALGNRLPRSVASAKPPVAEVQASLPPYPLAVLVGRDAERARVGALLEAAQESRSGALVIRGEPGIGKTALLEDARAQACDMQVLDARGVESESDLPFAGLHQLTRPALHLTDRLPSRQADGLRGALGLADRPGEDRFLISVACLSLLSELAESGPVLCLVDDAQWLDVSSADVLLFVARRLGAEGIAMLFAARESDHVHFEAPGVPTVELGPLDGDSAMALLSRHAGGALAPRVRDALVEQSRGNALALMGLPATLSEAQLAGEVPLPDTLPLTRDLQRLFLDRVHGLPEGTQRLLLVIAVDDSGRLSTIMRAAATLGVEEEALGPADGLVWSPCATRWWSSSTRCSARPCSSGPRRPSGGWFMSLWPTPSTATWSRISVRGIVRLLHLAPIPWLPMSSIVPPTERVAEVGTRLRPRPSSERRT